MAHNKLTIATFNATNAYVEFVVRRLFNQFLLYQCFALRASFHGQAVDLSLRAATQLNPGVVVLVSPESERWIVFHVQHVEPV